MEAAAPPSGFMKILQPYMGGKDLISQLLLAVGVIILISLVVYGLDNVIQAIVDRTHRSAVLFSDTTSSQQFISQDPSGGMPLVYSSKNEANGMEFTYSFYLMINADTFDQTSSAKPTLKHVFHKGFKNSFPVMAPGVFVESGTNNLRIYMNSATTWNNYVTVQNVPVGKWFHMIIMAKGQYLDVYINGNVSQRNQFPDVPRLNAGNVYVMYPVQFTGGQGSSIPEDFVVSGAISGMVSRLKYYAYALSYSEVDGLYREGPSSTIVNKSFNELPPYFHDDWWVTRY
jgi:hypothetical protein